MLIGRINHRRSLFPPLCKRFQGITADRRIKDFSTRDTVVQWNVWPIDNEVGNLYFLEKDSFSGKT